MACRPHSTRCDFQENYTIHKIVFIHVLAVPPDLSLNQRKIAPHIVDQDAGQAGVWKSKNGVEGSVDFAPSFP